VAGAANPDRKAMTAIASLLAGGDHVDDINALRGGRVGAEILGVTPAAASTVGTFLRAFTPVTLASRTQCRRTSISGPGRWEPGLPDRS